ncbi:MAG: nitrile hydratase subunit beta [Deltaproteobacteria bacterium]|nr:nitrile hydratase subunit beta [Deltaproteobacteria bacterium]
MSGAAGKFRPGDRVRVRTDDRPGHVRTPSYVRGKIGWVERAYGDFLNPESLGHGGDGLPKKTLYLVGFHQGEVWGEYKPWGRDRLFVDIYEHWLDPA